VPPSDQELYRRGAATLLASWEQYARGAAGAAVTRLPGASVATFPYPPERGVYNNALTHRDLGPAERQATLDAVEAAYAAAGVDRYAVWVHESDEGMRRELSDRGYAVAESTRAMGVVLDGGAAPTFGVEVEPLDWAEYLAYLEGVGVPAGLLGGADPGAFHALGVRHAEQTVASAISVDHEGDCGIFNMSTLPGVRRRGFGAALTRRHVHDARARGCHTASLQATPMAERVYASVGFRDLGRILEFAPP
jgi:ribosomal protein S18 acetylase RimI-like enzyme